MRGCGINHKRFDLKGVIVNCSIKLSDKNVEILQEKGDYVFDKEIMQWLFPQELNHAMKVREISLVDKKLTQFYVRAIGSDIHWINLRNINISKNKINDEGVETIANNKTWIYLEEMMLRDTELSDKGVGFIATNDTWKTSRNLIYLQIRSVMLELMQ